MSNLGGERRARLAKAHLYLCTPDRPDLAEFISSVCTAGVDIVQLRDKLLDARQLLSRANVARDATHEHGGLFIMNDRPDLALECGADGVHVGQDDVPPALCRRILGDDAIVGLSTHTIEELHAAMDEPVDYLGVGPVEPTPTKPGRAGTGLQHIRAASKRLGARTPFFVTGGVNASTLPSIAASGATRYVVVRAITEAEDPVGATKELRSLMSVRTQPII